MLCETQSSTTIAVEVTTIRDVSKGYSSNKYIIIHTENFGKYNIDEKVIYQAILIVINL